ncbi:MAG TPA: cbb3-type cytochrome c oxidase subunit 3 [Gammaproteobacteria bacterium]
MGWVYGVVTIILMIVFIGIVIWAWRDERTPNFEEAARLPLQEDKDSGEHQ